MTGRRTPATSVRPSLHDSKGPGPLRSVQPFTSSPPTPPVPSKTDFDQYSPNLPLSQTTRPGTLHPEEPVSPFPLGISRNLSDSLLWTRRVGVSGFGSVQKQGLQPEPPTSTPTTGKVPVPLSTFRPRSVRPHPRSWSGVGTPDTVRSDTPVTQGLSLYLRGRSSSELPPVKTSGEEESGPGPLCPRSVVVLGYFE